MNANDIPATGLTAAQAQQRAADGLANVMPKNTEGSVAHILKRNLFTLFNLLNLALAAVLFCVGAYRDMLFMGVVVSNTLIGTVQELRAKRTHDRLQLLSEGRIRVLRDGCWQQLSPRELVQDDVVQLSRGEQVPTDARVLSGAAQADESLLTGESEPVAKTKDDTLYSGSFLVGGSVTAVLTAVGANSYAGRLQLSARKVKRAQSELMQDLARIIRVVSLVVVPIGLILFCKQYYGLGLALPTAVSKAVASMIGMIPEGLMLLTSVALAAGVIKLGGKGALINELYGIETLARTDVVCMDKTGTLTCGDMVVQCTLPLRGTCDEDIADALSILLGTFSEQTPSSAALMRRYPPRDGGAVKTVPFSSERKWSAAQFAHGVTLVLGAPERLLHGDELALSQSHAAQGMRVLALCRACVPLTGDVLPDALHPMAILCLRDALRPNVQETIRYFGRQGVTLKVISGDSALTVAATAQDAGLPNADRMIDLSTVEGDKDYAALCEEYTIFGRVSPEDKRALIEALKAAGHGVAMVGDGVNDIPALKAADCSIAMAGGSDAACRVSQVTLMNGNFDAMPAIVLEGRRVINNITRASSLFLVKNIFSLLVSLALLALPVAYPFYPIQLTLISTLTIGFPSFVLALQPSRDRVQGRFLHNVVRRALPGGICAALLVLPVMLLGPTLGLSPDEMSTMSTLVTACSCYVVLVLTCLPADGLRSALIMVVAAALTLAVLLLPQLFYLTPIHGVQWIILAAAAVLSPLIQLGLGALLAPRTTRPQAARTLSA